MSESTEPYGLELAREIIYYLPKAGPMINTHRDYCGMGLWYENDRYFYGEVYDGGFGSTERIFESEEEFASWLAEQSDASLNGANHPDPFKRKNQRVTRRRLLAYRRYARKL
ncbi:MAG: hypothetical protein HC880_18670 [Bacteroidia bacterium]|nr:hypothetical protein [Bacteroidia bacterium]